MKENLLVGSHKYTTEEYRDGWDRAFLVQCIWCGFFDRKVNMYWEHRVNEDKSIGPLCIKCVYEKDGN